MNWTVDTIRPLVEAWDERVRRDMSRFDRLVPEAEPRGSVLRDPAPEAEIEAAEARLGRRLPPSYRAFLQVSNGAWGSTLGVQLDGGFGGEWWPAARVRPLAEVSPFTVDLWTRQLSLDDPEHDVTPPEAGSMPVACFSRLADGVLISESVDTNFDVLVPRPGVDEWELWLMHHSGADAYRSFASFLRFWAERHDSRPTPEAADRLVASVPERGQVALNLLAEIGDPRAGDLACAYITDPDVREFSRRGAARPLGLLGESRFVPCLRRAYAMATMFDFRVEILTALERCGDPDLDALLEEAVSDPDLGHIAQARLAERRAG